MQWEFSRAAFRERQGGGRGGVPPPPPPPKKKNCTVGFSSAHYELPSAVCKSFSPPISYCFLRPCPDWS